MSLIPESIRAFFGAFTGILMAFGGSIYYSDQSPRGNLNKYLCCARLSLRLESLDALDPESLKSAMRSKAESDEPLGHKGERYDNPLFHGIWYVRIGIACLALALLIGWLSYIVFIAAFFLCTGGWTETPVRKSSLQWQTATFLLIIPPNHTSGFI